MKLHTLCLAFLFLFSLNAEGAHVIDKKTLDIYFGPQITKLGLCKLVGKNGKGKVLSYVSIPIDSECPSFNDDRLVQTVNLSDGTSKKVINFISRLKSDSSFYQTKIAEYMRKAGKKTSSFNRKNKRVLQKTNELVRIELSKKHELEYGITLVAAYFYDTKEERNWGIVIDDSDDLNIAGFFESIID
jgi:hypothetical protein